MFSKIWHGTLITAIVMYSGNIFFATEPCERIDRSGSVVRVAASSLFFLSDNWMSPKDRISIRKQANSLDLWLQDVVRVTFFGKELQCANGVVTKDITGLNPVPAPAASTPAQRAIAAKTSPSAPVDEAPEEPAIVNQNPFNLPTLPD